MLEPRCRDDLQADLYRVALSLDALVVNGIQYGVINAVPPNTVVEKLGATLHQDLDAAQREVPHLADDEQRAAKLAFGAAGQEFRKFIALLNRLSAFKEMTLQELRTVVAQVIQTRKECVRLIEELERSFQVAKPFYRHRSAQAAASVDSFLVNLDAVMLAKWSAGRAVASPA